MAGAAGAPSASGGRLRRTPYLPESRFSAVAWNLEAVLALLTSAVVAGPTIVLFRAYLRTRSRRVLMAVAGFATFLTTDLIVLFDQLGFTPSVDETAIVEFVGDVITAVFFAAAFLAPGSGDP